MKVIIVALAFVAVAASAAIEGTPASILRSEFEQSPEGNYNYGFETSDGTSRNENGELKSVPNEDNKPQDVVVVRGSWTYTDNEGNVETVNYFADETGFHAEGPSIPKAPARR
ncbi:larval cuticle protein 1-like [Maniola hyperantus]|uniref:larval cuticle protein 1-like n=1 Tax=Aphantopus hyperantus TaxID=2795564 RepID=UPI0015680547|nr:larval cuticle protein 1-like [Maniola hyperantus]